MRMQISVRGVDEEIFREFKAVSVRKGLNLGKAISLAMKKWLEEEKREKISFLELEPVDWGEGTEESSKEVDETLYGV